jgi:hypothetical protein
MTKTNSMVDQARHDAQDLHKKISANMAKAETATWADAKAVQADIVALGHTMKTLTDGQAEEVKAGLKTAITKLEAAGHLIEDKASATKDGLKQANAAMLDSAHRAAQSLSAAVAAGRSKVAQAIAPKSATGTKVIA